MATWYCRNCKETFEEGHPDGIGDAVDMCDKCRASHYEDVSARMNELIDQNSTCPGPVEGTFQCPYLMEDRVSCGRCIAFYIKHGRMFEEKELR